MAAAGEVEMIAGMTYDYDSAQQRNLGMTRVYLNSQYVAVLNRYIDETDLSWQGDGDQRKQLVYRQ